MCGRSGPFRIGNRVGQRHGHFGKNESRKRKEKLRMHYRVRLVTFVKTVALHDFTCLVLEIIRTAYRVVPEIDDHGLKAQGRSKGQLIDKGQL